LRAGEPEAAVLGGVQALSGLVIEHFPRGDGDHDVNELQDLPYVL
jgi:hypothetical protein